MGDLTGVGRAMRPARNWRHHYNAALIMQRDINKKIYLINAESQGWIPPDCVESLDQLMFDAQRWIQRWSDNDDPGRKGQSQD